MTAKEHLTLHDKQITAIRTLVKEGIQMVVEIRRVALETRKDLRDLAVAQKRTEKHLADLILALGRGTNGKHGA